MAHVSHVNSLIALQIFQLVFLLAHDWLPLGRLNDLEAQRSTDSLGKRLGITGLSVLPYALLLEGSVRSARVQPFPKTLLLWLWVGYGVLLSGEIRAWWIPYLLRPEPQRAKRYRALFGRTHAFLRERNGIRPNTLHVVLHTATLLTVICLAWLTLVRSH